MVHAGASGCAGRSETRGLDLYRHENDSAADLDDHSRVAAEIAGREKVQHLEGTLVGYIAETPAQAFRGCRAERRSDDLAV